LDFSGFLVFKKPLKTTFASPVLMAAIFSILLLLCGWEIFREIAEMNCQSSCRQASAM